MVQWREHPTTEGHDCFFHAVAYAVYGDAASYPRARDVRYSMAAFLARKLFKPPYDDLDCLSAKLLFPEKLTGFPNPERATGAEVWAAALQAAGGVSDRLAEYVVWLQFGSAEVDQFERWYMGAKPLFGGAFTFATSFLSAVAEAVYGRPVDIYGKNGAQYEKVESGRFRLSQQTIEELGIRPVGKSICLLYTGIYDREFDALEAVAVPAASGARESRTNTYRKNDLTIRESEQSGKSKRTVSCKASRSELLRAAIMYGNDDSGTRSFKKYVNLPQCDPWLESSDARNNQGVENLDQLSERIRVKVVFSAAAGFQRRLRLTLRARPLHPKATFKYRPEEASRNCRFRAHWTPPSALETVSRKGQRLKGGTDPALIPMKVDEPFDIDVSGDVEVMIETLFLPVGGGVTYSVEVDDNGKRASTNGVTTWRRMFYHILSAENLSKPVEVPTFVSDIAAQFEPLYLDMRPVLDGEGKPMNTSLGKMKLYVEARRLDYERVILERYQAAKLERFFPYCFNLVFAEDSVELDADGRTIQERMTLSKEDVPEGSLEIPVEQVKLFDPQMAGADDDERAPQGSCWLMSAPGKKYPISREHYIVNDDKVVVDLKAVGIFEKLLAKRGEAHVLAAQFSLTLGPFTTFSSGGPLGVQSSLSKSTTAFVEKSTYKGLLDVFQHELGHQLGLVPGPQGTRDLEPSKFYYDERGHQGPHCHFGTKLVSNLGASDAVPGSCIMFGAATDKQRGFCEHCVAALLRVDCGEGFFTLREQIAADTDARAARDAMRQKEVLDISEESKRRWDEQTKAAALKEEEERSGEGKKLHALVVKWTKKKGSLSEGEWDTLEDLHSRWVNGKVDLDDWLDGDAAGDALAERPKAST